MSQRTSKNYIATYDYRDAGGMLQIEMLRNVVKLTNKLSPPDSVKVRLVLKGRFGRNNPNLDKYTYFTRFGEKHVNYQTCRLEDAQRVDVYIYERR